MAERTSLTVHQGGKAPARKRAAKKTTGAKKQTVTKAAMSGTRRELLVATRDRIAKTVDDPKTPPRDLAALTRRLMDISNEIEMIDHAAKQEEREREATPDEEWDDSAI